MDHTLVLVLSFFYPLAAFAVAWSVALGTHERFPDRPVLALMIAAVAGFLWPITIVYAWIMLLRYTVLELRGKRG